ncbi:MAG TPA: CBS domain-containing protein [Mycobacteriales bacterium]|nr:CBS domain-containing protein [Mycobacteriales bacterium]
MVLARELMTPADPLSDDATVAEAARHLAASPFDAVPVCDSEGRLRGVVTDRDLVVEVAAAGKLSSETRMIDLVRGEVVSVRADDDLEKVATTMRDYRTPRVPVLDGDRVVGMLSRSDVAGLLPDGLFGTAHPRTDV